MKRAARTPRAPRRGAGAALILLSAAAGGCCIPSGSAIRMGGAARPEYAPSPLPLHVKAAAFEAMLDRHISPEGINVYLLRGDETAAAAMERVTLSDCAIWTGVILGTECLRLRATGDPAALERARAFARGLHSLGEVTGLRGYFARAIARRSGPDPAESGEWRAGSGKWAGYRWKGDTSKDQYAGIVFGLGIASTLVDDPEVRDLAREDLRAVADLLIAGDYRIRGPDGRTTSYGGLQGWIWGVPIGVNALIALSAVKCAAAATGDPRYAAAYVDLLRRGYARASVWAKVQLCGWMNGNNDVMAILSLFNLLRLEKDPAVRALYARSCGRFREYVRHDGNSLFNFVVAPAVGGDRALEEDGRLTLRLFPLEKRVLPVDLRSDPRFEHACWSGRHGVPLARCPLPVNYRPQSAWAWRDDPRALAGDLRADGRERAAPTDFLAAYWIGRHAGIIGPDE